MPTTVRANNMHVRLRKQDTFMNNESCSSCAFLYTHKHLCMSASIPSLSKEWQYSGIWPLSHSQLSLFEHCKNTHTHLHTIVILQGESVFKCHLDPSFSSSVLQPHSTQHTHLTPPHPALMLPILFVGEWRLLLSETELSSAGTRRTEWRQAPSLRDKQAALRSGLPG